MEHHSRYRIAESADGFRVEGDGRPPVEVRFAPFGLEARFVGDHRPGSRERFGFFNFGRMLEFVARGLMREWRPHDGWFGARDWAQEQTSRSLARRLREHWLALLARADPDVLAVQRAIFAATFGDAPLATEPALYADRYFVQDVVRYPAAAVAVKNAETLSRELLLARLDHSPAAAELRQLADSMGARLELKAEPAGVIDVRTQVERLGDWKSLFADTGHAYRSLNRTLMNLPGRVPHRLVCGLRRVHLQRPLLSRLELLAVTLYAAVRAEQAGPFVEWADHSRAFHHATAAQVREAVLRVAFHLRQPLDLRRAGDVRQAVRFLADYPDPHRGNLVGLAERAIRWHRRLREGRIAALSRQYGPYTPAARPPVPLPQEPGVRFLETTGAIRAEGERMRHCVAAYLDRAVSGNCYLFHVDHDGEQATVEVGRDGEVRQACGPGNQRNKAAAYGQRVLSRWGTALRGHAEPEEDVPF